jgi:hypothetical protein
LIRIGEFTDATYANFFEIAVDTKARWVTNCQVG